MADKEYKVGLKVDADGEPIRDVGDEFQKLKARLDAGDFTAVSEASEVLEKHLANMEDLTTKEAKALANLSRAMKKVEKGTTEVQTVTKKAVKSQKDHGRAALEASRALEDLQFGIHGVINNIPGMIQSLGGSAGLTAVISIATVALFQLGKALFEEGEELKDNAREADRASLASLRLSRAKRETAREARLSSERFARGIDQERAAIDRATKSLIDNIAAIQRKQRAEAALIDDGLGLDLAKINRDIVQREGLKGADKESLEIERIQRESAAREVAARKKESLNLDALKSEFIKQQDRQVALQSALEQELERRSGQIEELRSKLEQQASVVHNVKDRRLALERTQKDDLAKIINLIDEITLADPLLGFDEKPTLENVSIGDLREKVESVVERELGRRRGGVVGRKAEAKLLRALFESFVVSFDETDELPRTQAEEEVQQKLLGEQIGKLESDIRSLQEDLENQIKDAKEREQRARTQFDELQKKLPIRREARAINTASDLERGRQAKAEATRQRRERQEELRDANRKKEESEARRVQGKLSTLASSISSSKGVSSDLKTFFSALAQSLKDDEDTVQEIASGSKRVLELIRTKAAQTNQKLQVIIRQFQKLESDFKTIESGQKFGRGPNSSR